MSLPDDIARAQRTLIKALKRNKLRQSDVAYAIGRSPTWLSRTLYSGSVTPARLDEAAQELGYEVSIVLRKKKAGS